MRIEGQIGGKGRVHGVLKHGVEQANGDEVVIDESVRLG